MSLECSLFFYSYSWALMTTTKQVIRNSTTILQNLCRKTPEDDETPILDYATLLEGIKKWPKKTTTSPSGHHLGIYKLLGKHVVKKKKENEKQPEIIEETGPLKQGRDVLYLIFAIMSLALTHAYPLQWWCQVWTIFIEKELRNPDLEWLWCIMIFEADWQLLLKCIRIPTENRTRKNSGLWTRWWTQRQKCHWPSHSTNSGKQTHTSAANHNNQYVLGLTYVLWPNGWSVSQFSMPQTWHGRWLPVPPCSNTPTDALFCLPQIWRLQGIQHVFSTPLAWSGTRSSGRSSLIYSSVRYANPRCLSYKSCPSNDAWPYLGNNNSAEP